MNGNLLTDAIKRHKIIAILRRVPEEKIIPVAEALYNGGIRLIEVTFDQSAQNCLEETGRAIGAIGRHFQDDMHVGAGTVTTLEQLNAAKESGAGYIISPHVDLDIIRKTVELGMLSIPGALTPSEIMAAYNGGAAFVKLFPGGEFGINYLKAIRAPISHVPLLIVGGVDKNNLSDFLKAGAAGFGIGSGIADKKLIDAGDYKGLEKLAREYTLLI